MCLGTWCKKQPPLTSPEGEDGKAQSLLIEVTDK